MWWEDTTLSLWLNVFSKIYRYDLGILLNSSLKKKKIVPLTRLAALTLFRVNLACKQLCLVCYQFILCPVFFFVFLLPFSIPPAHSSSLHPSPLPVSRYLLSSLLILTRSVVDQSVLYFGHLGSSFGWWSDLRGLESHWQGKSWWAPLSGRRSSYQQQTGTSAKVRGDKKQRLFKILAFSWRRRFAPFLF